VVFLAVLAAVAVMVAHLGLALAYQDKVTTETTT
jgi:hypothetical protein